MRNKGGRRPGFTVDHDGANNPRWKGGRRDYGNGYVVVHRPGHPRCFGKSNYVSEHVLVAEAALGRPLAARHPVHHVNGDKTDNCPANLVICEDDAYHKLLHRRADAFAACGHAEWLLCRFCGRHDDPGSPDMYVHPSGARGAHRSCRRKYRQRRRQLTGRWS